MRKLILLLSLASLLTAFQVQVLEETDRELILDISFEHPDPQLRELGGVSTHLAWTGLAQYSLDDESGYLEPFFNIPIAIPDEGVIPSVSVLSQQQSAVDWPQAINIPEEFRAEIGADAQLPESGIYHFMRPGNMRDYKLIQLAIMPARLENAYISALRLKIEFPRSTRSPRLQPEDNIPAPAVNSRQANAWRKTRSRSLSRSSGYETGSWYRIRVFEHGVYRITGSSFPDGVPDGNPANWKVYAPSQEGRAMPLSFDLTSSTPEGLKEIAVDSQGLDDGSFDSEDEISFFARGPRGKYRRDHFVNPYTLESSYWLLVPSTSSTAGKRVASLSSATGTADTSIYYYEASYYHENDLTNILHTGPIWLGEQLQGTSDDMNIFFDADYIANTGTVSIQSSFLGTLEHGQFVHRVDLSLNNTDLVVTQTRNSGSIYSGNLEHINVRSSTSAALLDDGGNLLTVFYEGNAASNILYLDSLVLHYPRRFAPHDELVLARLSMDDDLHQVVFENLPPSYHFWDITDPAAIEEWQIEGPAFLSQQEGDRYLLGFDDSQIMDVELESAGDMGSPTLRRQDLSAEYIIISPERFLDQAERLRQIRAERIREEDRMSVIVAPLQTVYDEFGGGMADPAAIKYFLHYAYHAWQDPQPRYVLFLGDADFDYRNITGQSSNVLPIWQKKGYSDISSYATDDWYVYVKGVDTYPDLASGRLPAGTAAELTIMVDKLEEYLLDPPDGIWKNTFTMVGDDPWRPHSGEYIHIQQCEWIVDSLPNSLLFNKVYLTEYADVQDPNSPYVKKPAAKDDLMQKVYNGTALVHFMGHGSPRVWAQEEVFVHSDLPRVNTNGQYPLWVAATCDWAKFDDVSSRCTPEELLAMPGDGAIGVISATRKSFSSTNYALFSKFYGLLFPRDDQSTSIPIGDALMIAKTRNSTVTSNDEKYVILCDPALKLATPREGGELTSISPALLKALGTVEYEGISDTLLGPGARAVVTAYDTPQLVTVEYAWPDGADPRVMSYQMPGRRIFRGQVSVDGDNYDGSFTVPRDIRYEGTGGILNVQYWDEAGVDGVVYVDTLSFFGSDSSLANTEGPDILFTMMNTPLLNGDQISANEPLVIEISDPQGINLTGQAGHGISLAIDGDWSNAIDITDLFEYDLDRSDRGRLSTILSRVGPGEHDISVRAWDNYNNPSTSEIRLEFFSVSDFKVFYVYNYPNPMQAETDFTFMLSHWAEVNLDIHTLSGRKIRSMDLGLLEQGFNSVHWDGLDGYGNELANGVYIYIITAENEEINRKETVLEKLVIAR